MLKGLGFRIEGLVPFPDAKKAQRKPAQEFKEQKHEIKKMLMINSIEAGDRKGSKKE